MRMAQQSAPVAMRDAAAASSDFTGGESRLLNADPPEMTLRRICRQSQVSRLAALTICELAGLFSRERDQ